MVANHAQDAEVTMRLPLALMVLFALLTFAGWTSSHSGIEQKRAARFEYQTEQLLALVRERLGYFEHVLRTGAAALDAREGSIDSSSWRLFATRLALHEHLPGALGIGLIERVPGEPPSASDGRETIRTFEFRNHPDSVFEIEFPVIYTEPASLAGTPFELDTVHDRVRKDAARESWELNEARVSAPMTLAVKDRSTPGHLFVMPYRSPSPSRNSDESFKGLIYAPFTFEDLVRPVRGSPERQFDLQVSDGETVLFDELVDEADEAGAKRLVRDASIDYYGRQWQFRLRTNARFHATESNRQPYEILAAGLLVQLLMLGFLVSEVRKQRALRERLELSDRLADRTRELEQSNRDLERFACVVSHDLKTPLRGIESLAHWVDEDLGLDPNADERQAAASHHMERLHERVAQMRSLIDGVLDYSGIGHDPSATELVDLAEMVQEIEGVLELDPGRIETPGGLPKIRTSRVQLLQVLSNLVGNAYQYHPEPECARVAVSAVTAGNLCTLRISDDGYGIDPADHERVFEMFCTADQSTGESTGIGLAIVRRTLERVGGSISIDPERSDGCTFVIEWPIFDEDACTGFKDAA